MERDSQLRTPAVRVFVQGMEQRRLSKQGWTSVFSIMRDGRELAQKLREAREAPDGSGRHELLRKVVDPYLQFVDADAVCDQTREFRGHHTQLSQPALIKFAEAAAGCHPTRMVSICSAPIA